MSESRARAGRWVRGCVAVAIAVALAATASTGAGGVSRDPLEPVSDPATALVSPLRIVTLATGDATATARFYRDGAAMRGTAVRVSASVARFWQAAPDVRTAALYQRPGLDGAATVRAVVVGPDLAQQRPGYDAVPPGGLAMGLPLHGQQAREATMRAAGFRSAVGVTTMTLPRGDGTTYAVEEIHYHAPDGVLVLGIDRGAMTPVGPIDPATAIGGPAYASMVVGDADKAAPFFRDVLGYELRREFTYTSGGKAGGLGLPDGTRVRFQQWYAPGARTGYVILLDLLNAKVAAPTTSGLARRGIAMWSFETRDLDAVARRAEAAGTSVVSPPTRLDLPGAGRVRALLLATPDGFPVEIYQREAARP